MACKLQWLESGVGSNKSSMNIYKTNTVSYVSVSGNQ